MSGDAYSVKSAKETHALGLLVLLSHQLQKVLNLSTKGVAKDETE
jgi:hypothetical protein